jgi:hypothetical protein
MRLSAPLSGRSFLRGAFRKGIFVRQRPLPTALENIETIAKFEQQCLEERSLL